MIPKRLYGCDKYVKVFLGTVDHLSPRIRKDRHTKVSTVSKVINRACQSMI